MKNSSTPLYIACILSLTGLLLVFGPILHILSVGPFHTNFYIYHYAIRAVNIISLPILGVLLIYLSIFVYHRRLFAVYVSGCLSAVTTLYLFLLYPHGPLSLIVSMLTLLYISVAIITRKSFTVKNNLEGLGHYLRRVIVIILIGFAYGTLGFYLLGPRFFHEHFSLLTSIDMTMDSLTGFSGNINEPTHLGRLFIDSLSGIGIIIFMFLLSALFRPLRLKVWMSQQHDIDRAEAIIHTDSKSSEDFFKLWPRDKQYYFSDNLQSFLAYKQNGRTVIVLGDPVGRSSSFSDLIANFIDYCHSLGWFVAVINATDIGQLLFEKHGLSSLFVGNEGVVNIPEFIQTTKHNKHFRYVTNKAERDKLTITEWETLTDKQLDQLHEISKAWLSRGNRREYTFFMGYFDRQYLRQCRIFILLENTIPVAYVNLIPSYYVGHASIDQFRSKNDISPIGMHFLLMKVIEELNKEHTKNLNVGLSPLSGIEKGNGESLSKAALQIVRFLGASYYSFEGIEQFKNKFKPNWEARSLLFTGSTASLVRITRDVENASTYEEHGNRQIYLSTAAGVIVLTLGLYFILG